MGILLFFIIFNGPLLRPAIPRLHSLNLKYIDDLSMLSAVNLKTCLVRDPVDRPRPFSYNERTQQVLENMDSQLQTELNELFDFTKRKQLRIKETKTQIMKFNFSKLNEFPPEFEVKEFKIFLKLQEKLSYLVLS